MKNRSKNNIKYVMSCDNCYLGGDENSSLNENVILNKSFWGNTLKVKPPSHRVSVAGGILRLALGG